MTTGHEHLRKLTDEQVAEILALPVEYGDLGPLAKRYGVTKAWICTLRRRGGRKLRHGQQGEQ